MLLFGMLIIPNSIMAIVDSDGKVSCSVTELGNVENGYNIKCTKSATDCCFLKMECKPFNQKGDPQQLPYGDKCGTFDFNHIDSEWLTVVTKAQINVVPSRSRTLTLENKTVSAYDGCNIDIQITGKYFHKHSIGFFVCLCLCTILTISR